MKIIVGGRMVRIVTGLCCMALTGGLAMAAEYYVAPDGVDTNPGTKEKPLASIVGARDVLRKSGKLGKESIDIIIREGTYYLPDTVVFLPEDSGAKNAVVTYSAAKGEKVAISGGSKLSLTWKPYRDGIMQAETPSGLDLDQLFVNGKRQHMARYPNFDPQKHPYNGAAEDAFSPARAANWADPTGGYIHAMHRMHWGGYHYRITGKDADNVVSYEGGWQNNRQMGMHKNDRMVENIFEELDAPGEWYHNAKKNVLYYYPTNDLDLQNAVIEVVRLKHLIEFRGNQAQPVHHIELRGLVFEHAARTFMDAKEPLLRSDWTIYRGGAVVYEGAEDCTIADCEFDQVGGNGVFVSNYNRRITIKGTHIHGAGASGICFVGSPESVRNPLFEYAQKNHFKDLDLTKGPKTDKYPADCVVSDCLIHEIGVVEKQAAGVQMSMSSRITVSHCSIYDVGRAGINISEGTFGGHLIEFCDVFDTVLETGDHGSFNSWGRDRFWHLNGAPDDKLPELSLLDTEKTVIRNSRWLCNHGWDIDLDDGSSNYEIYNNLMLRGGLKLREGFHRKTYNNVIVNNSFHPHVWYRDSQDVITNNIWTSGYRPIMVNDWGKEVDYNFFVSENDLKKSQANGCDMNSMFGDPMFVDPENMDYRVKDGSPVLQLGFVNFPMDQFGVKKAKLKALARVPQPKVFKTKGSGQAEPPKNVDDAIVDWKGAQLKELKGEQFSAFGVSKDDGGVYFVKVPKGSQAEAAGFKENDLILKINGAKIKGIKELKAAGSKPDSEVIYVRDQQESQCRMP